MTNGGTGPLRGDLLLINSGRGNLPPSLTLVNPRAPHNTTVLLDNFFGRQFNSLNDVKIHPQTGKIFFTDVTCAARSQAALVLTVCAATGGSTISALCPPCQTRSTASTRRRAPCASWRTALTAATASRSTRAGRRPSCEQHARSSALLLSGPCAARTPAHRVGFSATTAPSPRPFTNSTSTRGRTRSCTGASSRTSTRASRTASSSTRRETCTRGPATACRCVAAVVVWRG